MNPEDRKAYVRFEFTADKGQSPVRIDRFLVDRIENASRTKIQQAIDQGKVWVNDKYIKSNYKVRPNDRIEVLSFEEPRIYEVTPEKIDLDVIYEDDYVLVVNKPAGMIVHPGVGNYNGTLSNALAYYLGNEIHEGNRHPFLVHRIDKNTSGLLLVAKDEESTRFLADQFKAHTTTRKYVALVWGSPEETEGTIEGNIMRSTQNRKKFTVSPDGEHGKHAITHYKVIEDFTYTSLVECQLETGRTHQIRVHMKHLGHPLFSDDTYGGDRILKGVVFSKYKQFIENCFALMPRQALHAKTLGFVHPKTKERMTFDSELPEDFQGVLDRWRSVNAAYDFGSKD
ncbi:MAG: RluA family pseudouridine synthase [Bacteroidia bacterium]|nr:RluA family pseudouridine synthase [Bacteroidia bacterium]